jgi:hypothetical protein
MSEHNGTLAAEFAAFLDGVPEPGSKPKRRRTRRTVATPVPDRTPAVSGRDGARRWITLGMGCGIPCLSLALSSIGGRLWVDGHCVLGTGALMLCSAVLAVSLSHLAWAVEDITRSHRWQAWCLAAAVDLSLVLGELAGIAGYASWVVAAVMVSVTATSAVLNCWAFLRHGK